MKIISTILVLFTVLAFVGCATLPMESKLQKPVSMTKVTESQNQQFAVTKQALWLFWGAIPINIPTVDEVVGPMVADHEGVQDLKITTEYGFINFLISAVTSGVLLSATVTVQGTVY